MTAVETGKDRLVIRLDSDSRFLHAPESVTAVVQESLEKGVRVILITFTDRLIPFSQLVSVIMQCGKLAASFHAVVGVVTPTSEAKESLKILGVDRVAKLCASESDL